LKENCRFKKFVILRNEGSIRKLYRAKKHSGADPSFLRMTKILVNTSHVGYIYNIKNLQRSNINYETIPYITFLHTFIGSADIFDINHFNIGYDVVFGTKIKHFLGFG
jgi:hypothetical protein